MATRRLVLLFDGTWNDAGDEDKDETNVAKIYRLFPDSYAATTRYEAGVGVLCDDAITGGVAGVGIGERILGAYRFLQSRYAEDGYENLLYVFGFSRGAYTARVFAHLLAFCGIPTRKDNVQQSWKCYLKQDVRKAKQLRGKAKVSEPQIEMLGVWDTVKSTLDPDREDTVLPANVKAACHAMSIDEKRENFQVLRFDNDPRVTEVWFAGVHSDVGGGYPAGCSCPSDICLKWMVEAAARHGLEFLPDYMDYLDPDPKQDIHDSYIGVWARLGKRTRQIAPDDNIHITVKTRLDETSNYHPDNLPTNPHYVD